MLVLQHPWLHLYDSYSKVLSFVCRSHRPFPSMHVTCRKEQGAPQLIALWQGLERARTLSMVGRSLFPSGVSELQAAEDIENARPFCASPPQTWAGGTLCDSGPEPGPVWDGGSLILPGLLHRLGPREESERSVTFVLPKSLSPSEAHKKQGKKTEQTG